ncbi:MAG: hypothetical protein M3Y08_20890 [Fibrobacterota bacterium]|nr:hypothetical protein [Fibrobacterota bacterium]
MMKTIQSFAFALAVIGLSACNQQERISAPSGKTEGSGGARIALPVVPGNYLAKLGAGVVADFELTITGDGMEPIRRHWILSPAMRESVFVDGIPVGMKVFHGRLMKRDTATFDSIVTHEGRDSAWIEKDRVTDVRLYLRKGGGGSAHICVEVEGWPLDSSCINPPNPVYPDFSGCWNVSITKNVGTTPYDSLFTGYLRINQSDSSLAAVITWKSGAADTAYGHVRSSDGTAIIGYYLEYGDFAFKGGMDSSGQTIFGWFTDSSRGIFGNLQGQRGSCDSVIVVPPVEDTVACFSVAQALKNGKGGSGKLVLRQNMGHVWGTFNWIGFPAMSVMPGTMSGSILDSAVVTLHGRAPKGMFDVSGKVDSVAYKGRIMPNGMIIDATVYRILPGAWKALGVWKGYREACASKDSLP